MKFHARTDIGLRRRQNEDALLALDEYGLFVVADGVGGRMAGELASAITIDTFQSFAPRLKEAVDAHSANPNLSTRNEVLRLLNKAASHSSQRVFETASHTGREGMTSTVVAVVVGAGTAFVVHVGDSRAYLLRDGQIRQLTDDHSYINEMLRSGTITKEEAAQSRYKNVITRAIGLYPNVQSDSLAVDILSGDRLLLCSDGLSDLVHSEALTELLRGADIKGSVEALVEAALTEGGKDNITVIGIEPEPQLDPHSVSARAKIMESLFLFDDLPFPALQRVGRVVSDRIVKAGEEITTQGAPGDTMYVVARGQFSVTVDGQEVARLSTGEHFGELALVSAGPRAATVTATVDSHLLCIDRDELRAWCATEPSLGNRILWKLLTSLSVRLRKSNALYLSEVSK